MSVQVLLSCMHQTDLSIVNKSKISSDVIIINQADFEDDVTHIERNHDNNSFSIRMISTTERGLSRSRNRAIKTSTGDICLITDDDEEFVENYSGLIQKVYDQNPSIDVIAFSLINPAKKYPQKPFRVNFINALKISSIQISFRRLKILEKKIFFDEKMGSGTGNGGGEETKFIYDCLKNKLSIMYYPVIIATLKSSESKWFSGFTKKYFLDKGWAHKRTKGYFFGLISILRFVIVKYPLYRKEISFHNAFIYGLKGIFLER